jgi:hypothetical protein
MSLFVIFNRRPGARHVLTVMQNEDVIEALANLAWLG